MSGVPVLELSGVTRTFGATRAVDGVDLRVDPGEAVALVGRSGSGKTTLARLAVGLETPDAGTIRLLGIDLAGARGSRRSALRRVGMIGQDPYAALSPSMGVLDIVAEPLRIAGVRPDEARERATRTLVEVGLDDPGLRDRTSDELSGGERQRVGLARAIVVEPALLIADEATSMVDTWRQTELLGLLAKIRAEQPMALLFITHDLTQAARACERVVVMDTGRIVEDGPVRMILGTPRAPAARALVAAADARSDAIARMASWPEQARPGAVPGAVGRGSVRDLRP